MVTATYIDRIKYAQYVDGLVGEILSAPDIGRAVPKVLGELWQRRFVGADPRLVIDSIWSSIYGKVEEERSRSLVGRGQDGLKWSLMGGYYGLPKEGLIHLNRVVGESTRGEEQALDAIRRVLFPNQYEPEPPH